jgi:hypothetical protein
MPQIGARKAKGLNEGELGRSPWVLTGPLDEAGQDPLRISGR